MLDFTIFLIVPAEFESELRTLLEENVIQVAQSSIRVLTDASAKKTEKKSWVEVANTIGQHFTIHPPDSKHILLLHRDAKCDDVKLKKSWNQHGNAPKKFRKLSETSLVQKLKRTLRDEKVYWHEHATAQLGNFDNKTTALDGWMQQFSELGSPMVGQRLAMQLRVIRPGNQIPDPFEPRPDERFGLRQLHCYVKDTDRGGSWVSIQDALAHGHFAESVKEAMWDKEKDRLTLPIEQADEVILYEDGLWSGSETVRRLKALKSSPPNCVIRLKFAIVSDFGLMVVRHAIRAFELQGRVILDSSGSELMTFLTDGIEPEQYFIKLHRFINSLAFRDKPISAKDDEKICAALGAQLVKHWKERTDGKPPTDEVVRRFELGGGRFASTTVFSRSLPKVTLPLFWLDGEVELGDKSVEWKPLFIDPRRIGDQKLLSKRA